MTFEKGHPGGPGRPRGSRNKVNLLLDQLAGENAQEILAKVVEVAREGDRKAQDMVLRRLWSVPRGRPVEVDLPPIEAPADLVKAHAAIVAAVSEGELTTEEASGLASVLEGQRRAFELAEQEVQLAKLEDDLRRTKAKLF